MPSQTEALRESIAPLEAKQKGGKESVFLKGLRAQLVGFEMQDERAQERQERISVSLKGQPDSLKP